LRYNGIKVKIQFADLLVGPGRSATPPMPQFVDMLAQVGYVIGHGRGEGLKGIIYYNKI